MSSIKYRPIVIPKATMDMLLELPYKNRSNAIALYNFYYYTSIWQETDKPYCTNSYIAGKSTDKNKGLGWGMDKIQKYKKILKNIGLIKIIDQNKTRKKHGRFGKTYVKVVYYHSKSEVEKAELQALVAKLEHKIETLKDKLKKDKKGNSPCTGFTDSVKTQSNTYSNNKLNAYNNNTMTDETGHRDLMGNAIKKTFDERMSNKLEKVVRHHNKLHWKGVNKKVWIKYFENLRVKGHKKKNRIKYVLNWYCKHFGEEYVPEAYSAKGFCDKFVQIEDAMEREFKQIEKGEQKITCRKIERKKK